MTTAELTTIVSLILALSVASERLVEIVKGLWPFLGQQDDDPNKERKRRLILQVLAVVAGIVTTYLARDYLPDGIAKPTESWKVLGLGLLASGGSGFWNAILAYLTGLKDIKKAEAKMAQMQARAAATGGWPRP